MSQPPAEQEIERLLKDLNSDRAIRREQTIKTLVGPLLNDERIVAVLESLAARDVKQYVRDAARATLIRFGRTPPEQMAPPPPARSIRRHAYTTNSEKILDFVVGFVGWFVANVIAWFLLNGGGSLYSGHNSISDYNFYFNWGILPLNLVVMLIFAWLRHWVAFGILAAIAVNLIVALALGMGINALCAIPFVVK